MGVRLPPEYQEVEYLESTGVEYIDTEIIADDTTGFFVDGRKKIGTATDDVIIGSRSGLNSRFWADIGRISAYNNRFLLGWNEYHNTNINIGTNRFSISVNYNNDRKVYVNEVENEVGTNALTTSLYVQTVSIYLFAANNQGSVSNAINGQIFACRITKGSVLLADFIPCYRKSDSKPGMYDLVSGTFFVNQGTGEFAVGNDVIDSISPWLVARRRTLMQDKICCPYITDGLIFWLDGIHKGNTAGIWEDLIGKRQFQMSDVTPVDNGVVFNSSSVVVYNGAVSNNWNNETIEAAISNIGEQQAIFAPPYINNSIGIGLVQGVTRNLGYALDGTRHARGNVATGWKLLSVNADVVLRNGVSVGFGSRDFWGLNNTGNTYIGVRNGGTYHFFNTIYCIRIYNRKLTQNEMLYNQRIDNERFNLGLTI